MTDAEPIAPTTELTATVGEHLQATLSDPDALAAMTPEAIVALVVNGINDVQAGDPLGTIRRDPDTRIVYIRVNDHGVHKWRVVDPNDGGANAFDMRQLDYPVV